MKCTTRRLIVLASLVATAISIGWIWFGLGEFFFLGSIANDLPQPPDTERIRHWPSGSRSYSDSITFAPPDSWGMRETYFAPDGTTQYEIMDFYISRMVPEWRWCPSQDDSGYLYGGSFEKGTRWVGVDSQGLQILSRSREYEIYVDRKAAPGHCQQATERALGLGLKPVPEGSPGHLTPELAQQHVPFPIWIPPYSPEEYSVSVDAKLLEGWPYGDGVKGVELVFRNSIGPRRDLEAIFVRQFLTEEASSHAGAYSGGPRKEETVVLGNLRVKVQEGVKEELVGNRAWVSVEWDGEFQGEPIVYVVESGASREETLQMVERFHSPS